MLVKLNKNLILEGTDINNPNRTEEEQQYESKIKGIGLTDVAPKMDRRQVNRAYELVTKLDALNEEKNRLHNINMKFDPDQEKAFKQADFEAYDYKQKIINPNYRVATNPVILTGLGTLAGGAVGYGLVDDESLNGYGDNLASALGAATGGALSYAAAQNNIPGKIIKSNVIPNTSKVIYDGSKAASKAIYNGSKAAYNMAKTKINKLKN